jgi:hypothetical protein
MYQFKTESDLMTRLRSAVDDPDRKVAILFGSGLKVWSALLSPRASTSVRWSHNHHVNF